MSKWAKELRSDANDEDIIEHATRGDGLVWRLNAAAAHIEQIEAALNKMPHTSTCAIHKGWEKGYSTSDCNCPKSILSKPEKLKG